VVDHPRHGRAQAGDVGAAVLLRDVVGEGEQALVVAVVPLHGDLDAYRDALLGGDGALADHVEHVAVQDGLGAVDVLDKAAHAAGKRKVFFLAVALVHQADAHAVVEETELAQALGQDLVVKLHLPEDGRIGHEMHLGAAPFGGARHVHGRDDDTVHRLQAAVLRHAGGKLHEVHLAVLPHRQAQPLAERVHTAHAHAVQAAGDLVAVLVELAAGVQLSERDLGGRALGLVLVVELDAGGNAAAVVDDGNAVVGVDGDDDVVAHAGQRFVDGVVDDLEHHVMQAGAVLGVADVHAGAFAHGLQAFEDLDGVGAVVAGARGDGLDGRRVGRGQTGHCGHQDFLAGAAGAPALLFSPKGSTALAGVPLPTRAGTAHARPATRSAWASRRT